MGKLLDNTKEFSTTIDDSIANVMEHITTFKSLFDDTYMLNEFKDAAYLKGLLKEKIELGIRNNDN